MGKGYRRNHVVSECLLERFQDATGNIVRHDIIRGKDKITKPGLEGFRLNLWTKTSALVMETLWNQQAENDIRQVLAKIDQRERITKNDLEVLARFCAVHFVRSNEFIKLYEYMRQQKAAVSGGDPRLGFIGNYLVRLQLLKNTKIPSDFFEKTMTEYYHKSAQHLKKYGVEIGIATGNNRLILPDGGLLIADVQEGKYQPGGGVALMEARQAVLPLGPRVLLAFNAKVKRIDYRDLDDANVANANEKLLKACHQYYYAQP
jgi:hypothetical protein